MNWFVLKTRCRYEKVAEQNLKSRQILYFLPTIRNRKVWSDRVKVMDSPLFSGYIFVQPKLEQLTMLAFISGAYGLVMENGKPGVVRNDEIESMKQVLNSNLTLETHSRLEIGDPVRVLAGPLSGLVGKLIKTKNGTKLVLNVNMVGQSIGVEVSSNAVERI